MFEEVINELDKHIYSLKCALNGWPKDQYKEAYNNRDKKLKEFEHAKKILSEYVGR